VATIFAGSPESEILEIVKRRNLNFYLPEAYMLAEVKKY